MIGCDGDVTQRKLGENRVHLSGVRQNHTPFTCHSRESEVSNDPVSLHLCQTKDSVASPVTDEAQKAFNDLSTVRLLQQELL